MEIHKIKIEKTETPEEARLSNAMEILGMGAEFGLIGLRRADCECRRCTISGCDSHYFATALIVIGAAVNIDRHADLYRVLADWAQKNLPLFPPLRDELYTPGDDFPAHMTGAGGENEL